MPTGYTDSSYSILTKTARDVATQLLQPEGTVPGIASGLGLPSSDTRGPEPSEILLLGWLKVREARDHERTTGVGQAPRVVSGLDCCSPHVPLVNTPQGDL